MENPHQKIARIVPGALQRTWRSKHVRHEFERAKVQDDVTVGWYEVTDDEAKYLSRVRQTENPRSPLLFEIMTKAEVDQLAAEERARKSMGTHENPIGQKPGQYQPLADPAMQDRLLTLERKLAVSDSTNQRLESLVFELAKRIPGFELPPGVGMDSVGVARPAGATAPPAAPVEANELLVGARQPEAGAPPPASVTPAPGAAGPAAPPAASGTTDAKGAEKGAGAPKPPRGGAAAGNTPKPPRGGAGDLVAKLAEEGKISGAKPTDGDLRDSPEHDDKPV